VDQVEDTCRVEGGRGVGGRGQEESACRRPARRSLPLAPSAGSKGGGGGGGRGQLSEIQTLLVVSQTLLTKENAWFATWFASRATPELDPPPV
jgi:hypothetical protein